MQFLKTLFWALLAGIVVAFTLNNMIRVPLKLWGTLYADVNLPLLLLFMFLIGFVPPALALYATRWRMRQRLAAAERAVADLRNLHAAPVPAAAPMAEASPETAPVVSDVASVPVARA